MDFNPYSVPEFLMKTVTTSRKATRDRVENRAEHARIALARQHPEMPRRFAGF
jgi:hypothetical protein